ncbi:MAG: clostripain-related cysteine peptidase [Acidobacteria bacterium]|nr:clostripain-related cysteine peptidase [Acidobacteriota bacterium]
MPEEQITEPIVPEERREWTLMFYFASDNPLAPSIVNQLKALKSAGFHAGANVIAHFDPYTRNTPSHVFEVNVFEKLKHGPDKSDVGFEARDPSVHALVLDKIWEDDAKGQEVRGRVEGLIKKMSQKGKISLPPGGGRRLPLLPTGTDFKRERSPVESLGAFLKFCAQKYPANRYMLFILGHGVVVGNDIFLFDANPGDDDGGGEEDAPATPAAAGNGNGAAGTPGVGEGGDKNGDKRDRRRPRNSLALLDLRGRLEQFRKDIGEGSKFELLSFHSCSMSGVEVAYELQDTAHYMLASQGPAFVGSWPYRQILLRVFNGLDAAAAAERSSPTDAEVKATILDIFGDVARNSFDFQLAGYSFDVALCDLTKARDLQKPIDDLARALMVGLGGEMSKADLEGGVPLARELMLLAHWDAQSFWQENYTDLYDFCYRLRRRCALLYPELKESSPERVAILDACEEVMKVLEKGTQGDDDRLIVRAEFVGDEYQYSHGLSIFFPWAQPDGPFFGKVYGEYRLIKEKETAWAAFLDSYFEKTLRATRDEEEEAAAEAREKERAGREATLLVTQAGKVDAVERGALELLQVIGTRVFTNDGQLAKNGIDDRMGPPGKIGSDDRSGADDCGCPPFKNHPSFTGRNRRGKPRKRTGEEPKQPMSYTLADTIL